MQGLCETRLDSTSSFSHTELAALPGSNRGFVVAPMVAQMESSDHDWHVPCPNEIQMAEDLLKELVDPVLTGLNELSSAKDPTKKQLEELDCQLCIARNAVRWTHI